MSDNLLRKVFITVVVVFMVTVYFGKPRKRTIAILSSGVGDFPILYSPQCYILYFSPLDKVARWFRWSKFFYLTQAPGLDKLHAPFPAKLVSIVEILPKGVGDFPILYFFWCLILLLTKLCFVYIPSSVFPQNCFPCCWSK
jgi:hypothetical protein